jgi:hypothetical protein
MSALDWAAKIVEDNGQSSQRASSPPPAMATGAPHRL